MSYQLGIDLGTTYTAASVCRSSGSGWSEPEVVSLGTRSATVPSVLYIADDGTPVVGEAAERRAVTDPDRVVREFKRRIGDPTPIVIAGRAWAPEELSARLVRWVVDRVAEREGGPAQAIAVTHPASWGTHKKELLAAALARQGLTVMFLAEPQAAALHYAASERVGGGSTIAVYDLGGGTFDAAVVHKNEKSGDGPAGFGLLGRPEGLEWLGGVDFDQVVFDHVREGLPDAFEDLDDTDPAVLSAVARIRRECTEAKEALSSDTEVSIPVLLPASRGSVRLHRSEFEALIRPQVEETVSALRRAVGSAGLQPPQLTAVLLVGGSSRIPLVAQLVSEQLGRPVAVDADPKNAIAKGAALAISPQAVTSTSGGMQRVSRTGAGMAVGGGAGMPPPPRPGHGPMGPPGGPAQQRRPPTPPGPPPRRAPDRPPVAPAAMGAAGLAGAANRSPQSRISHESANGLLSGTDADMRAERRAEPEWDYDDYVEPESARRPIGLLIGVGGVLAAAAVVVGVMVWGSGSTTSSINPSSSSETTTSTPEVPPTSAPVAPGVVEPTKVVPKQPPAPAPKQTTAAPKPAPKQPPPVVEPTTEEPPPPSSSSSPPPPPVEPPPPPSPVSSAEPSSAPAVQPVTSNNTATPTENAV